MGVTGTALPSGGCGPGTTIHGGSAGFTRGGGGAPWLSPPGIVRGAGDFCRRLVYSRDTCASDRCPTMICAKYRTTCAASGMIHVGHRWFRSVMSHDDVHQWSPVPHWAGGLLDAAIPLGFWATVTANCARCGQPIFP